MAQNDPGKGGGGGGQQPSNKPSRPRGKSLFDGTNLMGAALWLGSAILTGIVLLLVFVPVSCAGPRGEVVGTCLSNVLLSTAGISTLIGAIFVQLLITGLINRVRNPTIARIGNALEWLINFVGLFWLVCIELGAAGGVYAQVSTFLKNLTVPTILWWMVLIGLSVGIDILTHNFFNAPPSGSGGSTTPPRR